MLRLLPMLSMSNVTLVNDNARRPLHSVSEEKRRRTHVQTFSKSRWQSSAKSGTAPPTRGITSEDPAYDATDSAEVRKPSRRPSVDEEALSQVSPMLEKNGCDTRSLSSSVATKAAQLARSRADGPFRSSIEAKKPCRRPSVDQEAVQQLAQLAGQLDNDCEENPAKESTFEVRKPSRVHSLRRVQERINESTPTLHEILGTIQIEFGDN